MSKAKREIAAEAKEHALTALNTLVEIAQGGESESARVSAATAILDRGYGKPTQILGSDPENPLTFERKVYQVPDEVPPKPNGQHAGSNGAKAH